MHNITCGQVKFTVDATVYEKFVRFLRVRSNVCCTVVCWYWLERETGEMHRCVLVLDRKREGGKKRSDRKERKRGVVEMKERQGRTERGRAIFVYGKRLVPCWMCMHTMR